MDPIISCMEYDVIDNTCMECEWDEEPRRQNRSSLRESRGGQPSLHSHPPVGPLLPSGSAIV